MTVKLSVAVMAHPTREAMVTELLDQLDRPAEVVWDRINDRHDTGIRAMQAFGPDATHHLVIQDDVVPCGDLIAGAERALAHVPDGHPVSLYIGRVRPFADAVKQAVAAADGASWITMEGIYWGPAIVLPAADIAHLAHWWGHNSHIVNYDKRISAWYQRRRVSCWYTWPCLVDHRTGPSLSHPTASMDRHAHRWHGHRSSLDIDWSGDAVHLHRTERLDVIRQQRAKGIPA